MDIGYTASKNYICIFRGNDLVGALLQELLSQGAGKKGPQLRLGSDILKDRNGNTPQPGTRAGPFAREMIATAGQKKRNGQDPNHFR
jgi:hypothetical protein